VSYEDVAVEVVGGKIHRAAKDPATGGLLTREADNLDSAARLRVLTPEELANADPDRLCDRCFTQPQPEPQA
jgi:hypothetical protein